MRRDRRMNFNEINKLAQMIIEKGELKEQKLNQLAQLKSKFKNASKEAERLRKLARVTGKTYEEPIVELEKQIKDLETEISKVDNQISSIELQIANGLQELTVDVNHKPEITAEKAIFKYTLGSCEKAILYLKQKLSFTEQLNLDGVIFWPEHVEILGADDAFEATEQFVKAVNTLRIFGSLMGGKEPASIQSCREYLHKSKHRLVWELLASAGKITLKTIFEQLTVKDSEEKRRIRSFLSDLQKRELSPFAGDGRGTFWLTTFGKQVKLSYEATYSVISKRERTEDTIPQRENKEEPIGTRLNKWLEVAYGEENDQK